MVCGLWSLDYGHQTFEYNCRTRSLKLSNRNKEFIWYRVLIGCFAPKYEYKFILKRFINIWSEGGTTWSKAPINRKRQNHCKQKQKKQTNKEKRNSLILNTENYKTERTTTKYLKWNKVLRKGKSSIICNQHVNNIQNIVNRHNRFRELRYFWDEL